MRKLLLIPAITLLLLALLAQVRIPVLELAIATFFVYFFFSIGGSYILSRATKLKPYSASCDFILLAIQFLGVCIVVSSNSFLMSTLDGGIFKPLGIVDLKLTFEVAAISTGLIALAFLLSDWGAKALTHFFRNK